MWATVQVRDVFKTVDESLALDPQLAQSMQGQQPVKQQSDIADTAGPDAPSNSSVLSLSGDCHRHQQDTEQPDATADGPPARQHSGAAADATDMQPLAERLQQQVEIMYFQWRSALEVKAVALTEKFKMNDELRAARDEMYRVGQQLQALERSHACVEKELDKSQVIALAVASLPLMQAAQGHHIGASDWVVVETGRRAHGTGGVVLR